MRRREKWGLRFHTYARRADFLGHSSIDSTAVYAHADNDAMAEALRSVDQEALPEKDSNGNVISVPEKNGKVRKTTCFISADLCKELSASFIAAQPEICREHRTSG